MTAERSGWFIYIDDSGHEWAIRLPRAVGEHAALGFQPLDGQHLPKLPTPLRYTRAGPLRPRHISLARSRHPSGVGLPEYRSLPVGTLVALNRVPRTVVLPGSGGPVHWTVTSVRGESVTDSRYRRARASFATE